MKITDILDPPCIRVPLKAQDKWAVIAELVDVLADQGRLGDRDQTLDAILARERTRSTGIGEGLAVPHGKSHGCGELALAIGKPATPLDFEAVDGEPCILIMLLASPVNKTGPHIQALARISRLWLNPAFRQSIAEATTGQDILAAIESHQVPS